MLVDPVTKGPWAFVGENRATLLAALTSGLSPKEACRRHGFSYATFREWLLKGADPESKSPQVCPQDFVREPYWSFARAVRSAMAEGKRHDLAGSPKGGRPAKLTDEQQTTLCDLLAQGWTYHAACRRAGVRLSTFTSWLRLGGYPRALTLHKKIDDMYIREPYKSFVARVLAAEDAFLEQ